MSFPTALVVSIAVAIGLALAFDPSVIFAFSGSPQQVGGLLGQIAGLLVPGWIVAGIVYFAMRERLSAGMALWIVLVVAALIWLGAMAGRSI